MLPTKRRSANGTRFYFYPGTSELTFNSVKLVANCARERTALSARSRVMEPRMRNGQPPNNPAAASVGEFALCISHGVCRGKELGCKNAGRGLLLDYTSAGSGILPVFTNNRFLQMTRI